ncbi:hypothetical protein PT974_11490 [Cladobotryum mycophilum]|uniref:ML-like domain-containing protein n=1 Tax=Cladobotryum mycophilum TaxID=491253 RepID=A0ABR0S5C7_9HYPO
MRPGLAADPNCQNYNHNNNHGHNKTLHLLRCSRHASRLSSYSNKGSSDSTSALPIAMNHRRCLTAPAPAMEGLGAWRESCVTRARSRWRCRKYDMDLATRPTILLITILIALFIATPAAAVQIPFQNCLGQAIQTDKPQSLQWVPKYVDAVFDTKNPTHNLRIINWGNVTGAFFNGLPPPNDPYWANPNETNGKIVNSEDSDRATTIASNVKYLTYEPYRDRLNFCDNLVNGTCPLGPVFRQVNDFHELPSFNISHNFLSSFAFTSFSATLLIVYGKTNGSNIGCVSATITPDLGSLSWVLKFLPLLVLIFAGFAVPFAGIFSPWGTTDIFHWSSNYGRDADLLRLVTPGFGDCLQYIQFIALTGALTLEYPGFFQPIVSQVGWSSLMFNESFVSGAAPWHSVVDGIYVTNTTSNYGLEKTGQLIGMSQSEDIWPGMMIWLCVIIAAVIVLIQAGFAAQWIYRKIKKIPEEDLRAKNLPFVIGNVVRIVFNFMLIPIVALSAFQLVASSQSPSYSIALAALTLALMIGFASWLLYLVISTKPKSVLFDDLPTVLRYGPLYNTYSDNVASFALIPLLLNFIRGIAIGAVQPSGVAQVVLLAICEVIQILMIYAIRPYQSSTSMNIYHALFCFLRLVVIMLMIAFAPSLGVTEGPKGWIGYVILAIHACVLIFGFFLGALQTIIEVAARMLGAGGDDVTGLTRGGLSKIFGMRQLSRRVNHRRQGPSRASQLSTSAMLDADDSGKSGYVMPSGRVRSGSVASLSGMVAHHRHRSSSALDSIDMYSGVHRNVDSGSSYMPGTPGEASTFSFLTSPGPARHGPLALPMEASDPYYRPPRRRRETGGDLSLADTQRGSLTLETKPMEPVELAAEISRGATPAPGGPGGLFPANRPDYSTREVDFYYGVRGPALNSDGPGRRRLGTGPADPTGPVATAAGWFRGLFGGKTKEKGKGFEVVRSSRMPPSMNRNRGIESPPEGIPVAMGVIRNGPIDSDDDDEPQVKRSKHREGDLLTEDGDPQSDPDEPDSPIVERLPRGRLSEGAEAKLKFQAPETGLEPEAVSEGSRRESSSSSSSSSDDDFHDAPEIPRKSSKRHSGMISHLSLSVMDTESQPPGSRGSNQAEMSSGKNSNMTLLPRLPFERQGSDRRASSKSSLVFPEGLADVDLGENVRPLSLGSVSHQRISRIDPDGGDFDLLGASAELVDEHPAMKQR